MDRINRLVFGFFFMILLFLQGCGGDSRSDIEADQKNLQAIYKAIRSFQSEQYFARVPENLEELHRALSLSYKYNIDYDFRGLQPSEIDLKNDEQKERYRKIRITENKRQITLIRDWKVFVNPLRLSEVQELMNEKPETKPHNGGKFYCDYELLPWYEMFMPPDTIIAWGKPGIFKTGGNVLFYDGKVKFLKMSERDYTKFTESLKNKNNRDYVRSKSPSCSIKGFAE